MQQTSFNNYAGVYDEHFTNSLIGKAQRKIVHNYISSVSNKKNNVLEINCGTGEDAVFLSRLNQNVICSDVSSEMVKICAEKIKLLSNCETLLCSIQEIEKINGKFNFLFSNFGGLNCLSESELKSFSNTCLNLTSQNADLIFVIMGRKCLWENSYFFLKRNTKHIFRRKNRSGVNTEIKGSSFQTYYYSPKEIKSIFQHSFNLVKCSPVGFFIPPSYLNPFFVKHKKLFSSLCKLETAITSVNFLSDYADHYLIHLKRK